MCGIIAVVRRRSDRTPPTADELLALLAGLPSVAAAGRPDLGALEAIAAATGAVDLRLRGAAGVRGLLDDPTVGTTIDALLGDLEGAVHAGERWLDDAGRGVPDIEALNAAIVAAKDAIWAVRRDRLRTAAAVADLAGPGAPRSLVEGYTSIQLALSALDRLEVRGRDSAGITVLVRGHGLDPASPGIAAALGARSDPLFGNLAARAADGHLSFVYKAAAEIGELGDNSAAIRAAVKGDHLLRQALAAPSAEVLVLGHTRWASVGIISEPNAHPLSSEEDDRTAGSGHPLVTGVLNGDVDNFADLKVSEGLRIPNEITTDAKVIPTLVARHLLDGAPLDEAFRSTVAALEGSVAIAASAATDADRLLLALRGSGQALYVGMSEDTFLVASEPYGVVEESTSYLRLDGETPADPDNPTATRGQIVVLDAAAAGTVAGIARRSYDGRELPVAADELLAPSITTRDIDRGDAPHFLLKEIGEAPSSFRKTLRGKLVEVDGRMQVSLPPETMPDDLRSALRDGRITRVLVIGQGTAAVAGQSLAVALRDIVGDRLVVEALLATELSGFRLGRDMGDCLVVAISQSGTTTDTNRTVDLVRGRGAKVVAIVNRRGSDLTDKADGVLFTSDGRDVEMSVASTKAFYSQIAAGLLLAEAIGDEVGRSDGTDSQDLLRALRELPAAMQRTLDLRPEIAAAAHQVAPSRRYWAIVGNGSNRIAANEIRIKLSELCYKAIACDSTEDKKHIDLSSEPLIFVCAAGLTGSTADDVAKEIAIYRAHKAAPVVVATEGEERFSAALHALLVPPTHPALAFVLATVVGHLFGYEAALAIDALAHPLREARGAVEATLTSSRGADDGGALLEELRDPLAPLGGRYFDALRRGDYDGNLEASTATRVASLLRFALGVSPLDAYQYEWGRIGTPAVVIEDLIASLTRAIEELTRPVDAIKHQAKTVTVGISRTDESLLQAPLVRAVLEAGAARDRLSYASLRTLATLDPAVAEVLGSTRYRIEGRVDGEEGDATIVVVDRSGLGLELRSRTETNPVLRGTKHRVASERLVLVARGRADGRTVVIIPEVKDQQATGLTLLHVRLRGELPVATLRNVLQGYRNRYAALRDAVTETEPTFRDDLLTTVPVIDLLNRPVYALADEWRST
jgi:glucosamine--fructose-6-phosphate aminotransferase (isomerizing)